MTYDDNIDPPDTSVPLAIDTEIYRQQLGAWGGSEAEAEELLRVLWSIMCTFVDLGWGVDSIHLALPELANFPSPDSAAEVSSSEHQTIKQAATTAFEGPSSLGDS